MFLLARDSWWQNLDDYLYLLIVLVLPALAQLGQWIRDKSGADGKTKTSNTDSSPKPVDPSRARPVREEARPRSPLIPAETKTPKLDSPPYAYRPEKRAEPTRYPAPQRMDPRPRAPSVSGEARRSSQPGTPSKTSKASTRSSKRDTRTSARTPVANRVPVKSSPPVSESSSVQTRPVASSSKSVATPMAAESWTAASADLSASDLSLGMLRRAIILREILDPPLGLRPNESRVF